MKIIITICLSFLSLISLSQDLNKELVKAKKLKLVEKSIRNNGSVADYIYADVKTNLTIYQVVNDIPETGEEQLNYVVKTAVAMVNVATVKATEEIVEGGGPLENKVTIKLKKGKTAAEVLYGEENNINKTLNEIVVYFETKEAANKFVATVKAKIKK